VYVGYTPAYYGSYVYGGCVVYGTGYYYHPWYGAYLLPAPVTYGFRRSLQPVDGLGHVVRHQLRLDDVSFGGYGGYWGAGGYGYGYGMDTVTVITTATTMVIATALARGTWRQEPGQPAVTVRSQFVRQPPGCQVRAASGAHSPQVETRA
jgi:hypothetical protein